MEQQKGSMLLKIISIIMIVGGVAGAISNFIAAGVVAAYNSNGFGQLALAYANINVGLFWFGFVVTLLGIAVQIFGGVVGIKNWNNAQKAQFMMIIGIVAAALALLANILVSVAYSFNFFTILTGLVVPVLYIVGSIQLKNQA